MFKLIRQSVLSTLCLAVLLCAAYPLLVTGVANAFFPKEAAGSLILRDGAIVGSALIGQPFSSAKYFHPRPSAAGYDAGSSSGSNYGPTSKALAERVRASVLGHARFAAGLGAGRARAGFGTGAACRTARRRAARGYADRFGKRP